MMKRTILFLSVIAIIAGSCHKPDGDLVGTEMIRGRLFLLDTLTQQVTNTPLSGKKVMIRYQNSTDTTNFIVSATTDANGNFTFGNLTSGTNYTVFYSDIVNNIVYYGSASAAAPSNTVVIIARVDTKVQNAVIFKVTDYAGNVIKGASIAVFTSSTAPGYVNNTADGNAVTFTTDPDGHANSFTFVPGTYYYLATDTENGIPLLTKGTMTVTTGLQTVNIALQKPNGIHFLTTDKQGSPIGNATVCLFNSYTLFKTDTCLNSNISIMTAVDGTMTQYNLNKGKYYLLGQFSVSTVPWIARDSVVVGDTIVNVNLILDKK